MKNSETLKYAGLIFVAVASYLVVTKIAKTGGAVADTVKKVVTEDLNPASTKNVVYTNLPETVQEKIGNFFGKLLDPSGYAKYQENLSAVNKQGATMQGPQTKQKSDAEIRAFNAIMYPYIQDNGAVGGGQSSPEFAAQDPRRLDFKK